MNRGETLRWLEEDDPAALEPLWARADAVRRAHVGDAVYLRGLMELFIEESCGQCTPCREGNAKLLEGIGMFAEGRCSARYLDELVTLREVMQSASKCGLGQPSPNAFLSIVAHYRDELMGRAHNRAR